MDQQPPMEYLLFGIAALTISLALSLGVYFFTRASYEPVIAKLQKQVASLRANVSEPESEDDDKTESEDEPVQEEPTSDKKDE